jgi:hypothetical protein
MKLASVCLVALVGPLVAWGADSDDLFETKIRPVLAKNCFACHTQSQMGGLRLDSRDAVLKGGKSGPALIPGDPDESLLIQAVSQTHERLKMPPSGKLGEAEIGDLTAWVKAGAVWPQRPVAAAAGKSSEYRITPEQRGFWSFQPVRAPEIPRVTNKSWVRTPIDNFILARLEKEGLKPVAFAEKRTWLRRVSFDLLGLPPTAEEVDAFIADRSPNAYAKVVDRLLESPHYGERWGRFWLDIARYSDDRLNSTQDEALPNSFRYRDWVIRAFNEDMPYDIFIKAQLAGDSLSSKVATQYRPGLGFYALSPEMQDDRVDATTRGFLGLTVACAQCHDHKFDPIPTKDYYSLQSIFANTQADKTPLAAPEIVDAYQKHKAKVDKQEAIIKKFYEAQTQQLSEMLAAETSRYLLASRSLASAEGLDNETLERWTKYLGDSKKDHPHLKSWFDLVSRDASKQDFEKAAAAFQELVLSINDEKKLIDEKNRIVLGIDPDRRRLTQASLVSLDRDKYILWRDLFEKAGQDSGGVVVSPPGVLYYGPGKIDRFLQGQWKQHVDLLKAELASLKKSLPEEYPYFQAIKDRSDLQEGHVLVRGDRNNPGEVAPRRFLAILSHEERKPFQHGSGRLDFAEAITDPKNPLTARVMANRMWLYHFGQGLVRTPSNFGQLGDRPSNPALLDYLAWKFVQSNWSMKAMHREILLSATYALRAANSEQNFEKDPDNRLHWRFNRRRMDVETLRDSILAVTGTLDPTAEGPAAPLDEKNHRRTVYGFVSRRKLDGMLSLFDFPNPNNTAEQRESTNVPLQRLFLMNSKFMDAQARVLADSMSGDDQTRVRLIYRRLFGRSPKPTEMKLALDFLRDGDWTELSRVLLGSNEFMFVD